MTERAAPAAGEAAFELRGVTVRFPGVTALDDVSLTIARGELVGLVGPSGAGKTTLLQLLNAGQALDGGTVIALGRRLDHLNAASLKRLRGRIGFIPQRFHLVPSLRVLQNVMLGRLGQQGFWASLRSFLTPGSAEQEAVYQILQRVGVEEKLFVRTDHLSGGQQQRVAIARALYQKPEAILADEPVASVDPARAVATMKLLTRLAGEEGLTLGVSLHDRDLARAFLPRLIGIRGGRVFKDASSDDWSASDFAALYAFEEGGEPDGNQHRKVGAKGDRELNESVGA